MHNFLSLTKVLFINNMGLGLNEGKGRKGWMILLLFVCIVGILPLLAPMYEIYDMLIKQTAFIGQSGTILALCFSISAFMTFFFSLLLIPGVFYYAKDIQNLLFLPLKAETILASKFTICLLFEYLLVAFITFPALYAYMQNGMVDLPFILFFLMIFFTLPILPLIYSSLLTMFIMRFVPFFKDREKFSYFAGIISIVLGLCANYVIQNLAFHDPSQIIAMILSGKNSLIALFSTLFPTISYASFACIEGDILSFFIYIGITCIAFFIFLWIAKILYFKGVIGIGEAKSKHKITDSKLLHKQSGKKTAGYAYLMKEIRILFRTPMYFLNCISIIFLLPVIFIFTSFSGDIGNLFNSIPSIPWNQDWLYVMILAGAALGLLYSNITSISSTAISREGSNYTFMKYIPVSYSYQVRIKALVGIIFSEMGILLVFVPTVILLQPPFLFALVFFITSLLACIMGNFIGIMVDIFHPKLVWEQEAAAVKQNMNNTITMIACMAIPAIMIMILVNLNPAHWMIYSFLVLGCILISLPLLYHFVGKLAEKQFQNL